MLGMYSMFLDDSGVLSERVVAKTVLFEAYCLASSAPRPREAPTMRTLGILAVWLVTVESSSCQDVIGLGGGLNAKGLIGTK